MNHLIRSIHHAVRSARTSRHGVPQLVTAESFQHKEYPRMERIALPKPSEHTLPLHEVLTLRNSLHQPQSTRAFTRDELGTLLGLGLGIRDKSGARTYPSGGALYPVETYLIGSILEGHEPGVFHYHPSAHALEYLWKLPATFHMDDIVRSRTTVYSSALMVFTGVWDRSNIKYGDYSYLLTLLETGHMAQNILLVATSLGLESRPIGGIDDGVVSRLLDLDPAHEQPIYGIVLSGGPEERIPMHEIIPE